MFEIIKDRLLMIFLVLLIIGIIAGGAWFYFKGSSNNAENTANVNSTNTTVDNSVTNDLADAQNNVNETNTINNVDHSGEYIDLSNWCGTYKNISNDKTFSLYQGALLELQTEIFQGTLKYDSTTNTLSGTYPQFGGDTTSVIEISIDQDVVVVKAKTTDPESDLGSYAGKYKKVAHPCAWNGIYKNELGTYVILSEAKENDLRYTIIKDSTIYSGYIEKYADTQIEYTNKIFEEEIKLNLERTETGIKLQASSTDTTDLYNKISGEYIKLP